MFILWMTLRKWLIHLRFSTNRLLMGVAVTGFGSGFIIGSNMLVNGLYNMAICILDKKNGILNYAGAYNPFILFRKDSLTGEIKMTEIAANRQPVGIFAKEEPFISHDVSIVDGDMFYIYSDGFYSQFGGENRRTYKSQRFKQFLASICKESTNDQLLMLENEFEAWKGTNHQVDDVIVIGVRLSKTST